MADRVEKEIEEILRKIDDFVPERAIRKARKPVQPLTSAQAWLTHNLSRVSMNKVMFWALFVVMVSFFVRAVPGVGWLMIGALIVFVTAFLLSRRTGVTPATQKRWRGEPIDLSGPSLPNRVKAWIKGRRHA